MNNQITTLVLKKTLKVKVDGEWKLFRPKIYNPIPSKLMEEYESGKHDEATMEGIGSVLVEEDPNQILSGDVDDDEVSGGQSEKAPSRRPVKTRKSLTTKTKIKSKSKKKF